MRGYETFTIHFERAAQELARSEGDPSLTSLNVSRSAWDRWMVGDIKGLPRHPTRRVLEHLLGETAERLFGPAEPEAGSAGSRREDALHKDTGGPHVAALESFRLADRQLGGGHLYRSVVHYLTTVVAPGLVSAAGDALDSDTAFGSAVVLTEMAAWMAHDAGRDDLASAHFARARRLAKGLADGTADANVLAGMSHLALQTGQLNSAVERARSGLAQLSSGPRVPILLARLHAMEARAQAQRGERREARRSLDAARAALALAPSAPATPWIAPFDEAALASETASALLDLGDLEAAAHEARRAVTLREATRARSRAFGHITLARVLLAQERVDVACHVGYELLLTGQTVTSQRLSRQLDLLQDEFRRFHQLPDVRELLSRMTETRKHRRLLLGSLALPEGPQ
ncbi:MULTISPECIES: hypothetical protein [unclassified Streptomyces]|uniref:hypothetical protein n=1 Tax=unclassified Streptomyces TaxID=2593676 RepID=UPI001EFE3452|nr:hypothetical protein [Streptomyces sp. MnatMP-M77]